jgi:transposase
MARDMSFISTMTQGRPTTKEMRELVVYQTIKLGWNTGEVSKALNLTSRTVQRIMKLYNEIGAAVVDPSDAIGRPRILSQAHINVFPFLRPSTCYSNLYS